MTVSDSSSQIPPASLTHAQPLVFEEFFELGQPETESPFLTKESRPWGYNLTLKASLTAAALLVVAFAISWHPTLVPLSKFLLVGVYFLAGIPALIESLEDLSNFQVNIDILMTLAAFSSVMIGSEMEGALLLVLFSLSGAMEDAVSAKAKSALSSLHQLSPTRATVIMADGNLVEKAVRDVAPGTSILIRAGQVIPLDGVISDGISSLNMVHLTGENFPITVKTNDTVQAGSRNLEGLLTVKVTHSSGDSTLAKIIQLVTQAQEARPRLQRWFDSLSRRYAITIILLAFGFAMLFPWLLGIPFLGIEGSVYRALAFLIAASPCALIIAIPIAYLSAVSVCARNGILLKGGVTLDALASCKAMAFDKTGTLTTGDLTCEGIESLSEQHLVSEKEAWAVAHALERGAVHPIAKAILNHAQKLKVAPATIRDFKSVPGYGLEGVAILPEGEQHAFIGNAEYILPRLSEEMREQLDTRIEEIKAGGELVAVLLIGAELFIIRFHDTLRPKIVETLTSLKTNRKMDLVMLTGDHHASAARTAKEVGLTSFEADLRPEDKLKRVTDLATEEGLAMVGDGINDAPALARATVGICMGKVGSTPAIDAADIILLHDNIEKLDWLVGKAHMTQRIVRENLFVAAGAILIASTPALAGIIPLWLAVILHEGGTVLVGLNALRLLRR